MKYASFKITDVDGINAFLAENSKKLAQDSITYHRGLFGSTVSFLFQDSDSEQRMKDMLIAAIEQDIEQNKVQLLGAEADCRYMQSRTLTAEVDKTADAVQGAEDRKANLQASIRVRENILRDLRDGKDPFAPKAGGTGSVLGQKQPLPGS